MKIRALSTFTAFTGQMCVFNAGDEGDLPENVAAQYIEAGHAEALGDLDQLDHDDDGNPGGSNPLDPPALAGKNKAALLAIAADEGVTVADDATNKVITAAIEAKRAGTEQPEDEGNPLEPPALDNEPGELVALEGTDIFVLISIEDDKFVVHCAWLEAPEFFDTVEAAEARQAELREAGPPEGWEPPVEDDAGADEEEAPAE